MIYSLSTQIKFTQILTFLYFNKYYGVFAVIKIIKNVVQKLIKACPNATNLTLVLRQSNASKESNKKINFNLK